MCVCVVGLGIPDPGPMMEVVEIHLGNETQGIRAGQDRKLFPWRISQGFLL